MPGQDLCSGETAWGVVDHHRGSWQCGDADRSRERWAAYGAYDESGAFCAGDGSGEEDWGEGWRIVAGYFADDAGIDGVGVAEADDGGGFAGGIGLVSRTLWLEDSIYTIVCMTQEDRSDDELPPELEAGFLADYEVLKSDLRRSAELSSGFYDKIAALSAGSIAVSVSVGLAIFTKPELLKIRHGLVTLILCFWLSLLCSIAHNRLLLWSAILDATYSRQDFMRNVMKRMFAYAGKDQKLDQELLKKIRSEAELKPISRQRGITRIRIWAENAARIFGYLSISLFFIAYTMVVVGAVRIWW